MNITLSAEQKLIKKTRDYAARHGTSMNSMIREYMKRVTGVRSQDDIADEFAALARREAGSSGGQKFNREEAHKRT